MDDDADFTFSQACPPVQEHFETPDISNITINDKFPRGTEVIKNDVFSWKDELSKCSSSTKVEIVGHLSFTVTETSSPQKSSELASEGFSGSAKISHEKNIAKKKPVRRAKIPFEKGYSQMDWLKLTQIHPDLAGLMGRSNRRLISLNEVKEHRTEGDMWTVLKGRVYNLSPYIKFHPGGVDILMKAVGKDCTSLFNKYHAWVNAEFMLEKCLLGTLDIE